MLELFFYTGVRNNELTNILMEDVCLWPVPGHLDFDPGHAIRVMTVGEHL